MASPFNLCPARPYTKTSVKCSQPAIAINNSNQIIEVHCQLTGNQNESSLYYFVGTATAATFNFPIEAQPLSSQENFGHRPSVAIMPAVNNNFVIVTYLNIKNQLAVKLGRFDITHNLIHWIDAESKLLTNNNVIIGNVTSASVAINDFGIVVVAYSVHEKIYFLGGVLDNVANSITWNSGATRSTDGINPKIALNGENTFLSVIVPNL